MIRLTRRLLAGAFVFAALTCAAGSLSAADWPQWRGPERNGISKETGLLREWPDDGPPLAWTAKGLGDGYSAPSVAAGRIYVMGEDKRSSYVRALDEQTGKIAWSAKVGNVGGGAGYPGPRATPTVDGERVYAIGQFGDLVCVETKEGKEIWRKNLEKDFNGKMMSGWGYSESPLIDGDKLICTPGGKDGTLAALNKTTGETIWRSKAFTDSAAYSSVIIAEIGGKRTYVQFTGDSVAGVDAENGDLLWRQPRKGPTAVIPTPVYSDNHVFVTSGYGAGGDLYKITQGDDGKFKTDRVYHTSDLGVHIGGVVLVDGHLYGINERSLVCLDFLTGKLKWKDRSVGKGATVYADGHLYVRSDGKPGPVALVEARPDKYVEKGQFEQPDGSDKNTWPPPVIANGKMYLRDQDVLFCYDISGKKAVSDARRTR